MIASSENFPEISDSFSLTELPDQYLQRSLNFEDIFHRVAPLLLNPVTALFSEISDTFS